MKSRSLSAGRQALTSIAAAALCLTAAPASALGLGRLVVRSALGESLRAEIDVTSLSAEEASNLRIRVAPPEQYRTAGVEYSSALQNTQAVLQRRADGRVYVRLTGDRAVLEPFVDVILELTWNTGRLVRDYTLLLDPPQTRGAAAPAPLPSDAPLPATSPIISAAQGDAGDETARTHRAHPRRREFMACRLQISASAAGGVKTETKPVRLPSWIA